MTRVERAAVWSAMDRTGTRKRPEGPKAGRGVLVVVPTYNEGENLENLLDEVHDVLPQAHVLVIDDNSPDGTGAMADAIAKRDKRVHAVHRAGKLGLGTAYVAGYRWALERDYEAVVQMDADFSHDPHYLPGMLAALGDHDLVVGSRYVHGISVVNWKLVRLMISMGGCWYARFFTRLPITDVTGGFKIFRRTLLARIPLDRIRSNGYAFQIEMNFWSHRLGGRIVEFPIIFVDRRVGVSKMGGGIVAEAMLTPFRLWLDWLRHRP